MDGGCVPASASKPAASDALRASKSGNAARVPGQSAQRSPAARSVLRRLPPSRFPRIRGAPARAPRCTWHNGSRCRAGAPGTPELLSLDTLRPPGVLPQSRAPTVMFFAAPGRPRPTEVNLCVAHAWLSRTVAGSGQAYAAHSPCGRPRSPRSVVPFTPPSAPPPPQALPNRGGGPGQLKRRYALDRSRVEGDKRRRIRTYCAILGCNLDTLAVRTR